MQTFLIGGCPFCDSQDCTAGQCISVQIEEVFPFSGDIIQEEITAPIKGVDWKELQGWWYSGNEDWDVLQGIVSRMLEAK